MGKFLLSLIGLALLAYNVTAVGGTIPNKPTTPTMEGDANTQKIFDQCKEANDQAYKICVEEPNAKIGSTPSYNAAGNNAIVNLSGMQGNALSSAIIFNKDVRTRCNNAAAACSQYCGSEDPAPETSAAGRYEKKRVECSGVNSTCDSGIMANNKAKSLQFGASCKRFYSGLAGLAEAQLTANGVDLSRTGTTLVEASGHTQPQTGVTDQQIRPTPLQEPAGGGNDSMNPWVAGAIGAGLGAGVMYFLDPKEDKNYDKGYEDGKNDAVNDENDQDGDGIPDDEDEEIDCTVATAHENRDCDETFRNQCKDNFGSGNCEAWAEGYCASDNAQNDICHPFAEYTYCKDQTNSESMTCQQLAANASPVCQTDASACLVQFSPDRLAELCNTYNLDPNHSQWCSGVGSASGSGTTVGSGGNGGGTGAPTLPAAGGNYTFNNTPPSQATMDNLGVNSGTANSGNGNGNTVNSGGSAYTYSNSGSTSLSSSGTNVAGAQIHSASVASVTAPMGLSNFKKQSHIYNHYVNTGQMAGVGPNTTNVPGYGGGSGGTATSN